MSVGSTEVGVSRVYAFAWPITTVSVGLALGFLGVAVELSLPVMVLALSGTAAIWAVPKETRPTVFLVAVAVLLAGYLLLGRGFAYLGRPPVFVGELVLALGIFVVFLDRSMVGRVLHSPSAWALIAFGLWGAACTLPYVPRYGVDALRDAVLWGYGGFAVLVAACLLYSEGIQRACRLYARLLPWIVASLPLAVLVRNLGEDVLPRLPASGVPIVGGKPGDAAVHLAGAGAFLVLGLYRSAREGGHRRLAWSEWVCWAVWALGCVIVTPLSRGGTIALLCSLVVAVALGRGVRWLKPFALTLSIGLVLLAIGFRLDIGAAREISVGQVGRNLQSVVGNERYAGLSSTKRWRLDWWGDIATYTFTGDYFWMGKGFGVNLADSDGYQTGTDIPLRSPHNGHMTVLARSGVPGLALWITLQACFVVSLLRARVRAISLGRDVDAALCAWILAYWFALLVNGAFDVFLEGPQGGIWFWSLFGAGIAAALEQRRPLSSDSLRHTIRPGWHFASRSS